MRRWRAEMNAMLSCDEEAPEGESFASAFAAAVADGAEVLAIERIENGASLTVAVEADDQSAAAAQIEELLEGAVRSAMAALAVGEGEIGWTAGVRGIEPLG